MGCWVNHFSGFGFSSFNNHTQKLKSPLFDIIHQTYGLKITGFDPSLTLPVTKKWFFFFFLLCLVTQSCLTSCNPMDYSHSGFSVHGDFPGKNTGVGYHAVLQRIFPAQGSNPGLPHCRQILYHLIHQGRLLLNWILSKA